MSSNGLITRNPDKHLAFLDGFITRLDQAESLEEVTELRGTAEALRTWARSAAKGLEAQNAAASMRLRAERKAGEMLSALHLRGGDRKSKGRDDRLKLSDVGVSANQSKRWQKQAAVPEEVFEEYLSQGPENGIEISSTGLLRHATGRKSKDPMGEPVKHDPTNMHQAADTRSDIGTVEELRNHIATVVHLLNDLPKCKCKATNRDLGKHLRYFLTEIDKLMSTLEFDVASNDGDEPTLRPHD